MIALQTPPVILLYKKAKSSSPHTVLPLQDAYLEADQPNNLFTLRTPDPKDTSAVVETVFETDNPASASNWISTLQSLIPTRTLASPSTSPPPASSSSSAAPRAADIAETDPVVQSRLSTSSLLSSPQKSRRASALFGSKPVSKTNPMLLLAVSGVTELSKKKLVFTVATSTSLPTYRTRLPESEVSHGMVSFTVSRTGNNFLWLHDTLKAEFPLLVHPVLPNTKALVAKSPVYLQASYESFLQRLATHSKLATHPAMVRFLTSMEPIDKHKKAKHKDGKDVDGRFAHVLQQVNDLSAGLSTIRSAFAKQVATSAKISTVFDKTVDLLNRMSDHPPPAILPPLGDLVGKTSLGSLAVTHVDADVLAFELGLGEYSLLCDSVVHALRPRMLLVNALKKADNDVTSKQVKYDKLFAKNADNSVIANARSALRNAQATQSQTESELESCTEETQTALSRFDRDRVADVRCALSSLVSRTVRSARDRQASLMELLHSLVAVSFQPRSIVAGDGGSFVLYDPAAHKRAGIKVFKTSDPIADSAAQLFDDGDTDTDDDDVVV